MRGTMERYKWQNFFTLNLRMLRILGFWPNSNQVFDGSFYNLYQAATMTLFMIPHVLFQTVNMAFQSRFEVEAEIFFFSLAKFLALVKVITFIINMKELKHLIVSLESDIFQPKNVKQVIMIQPAITIWRRIFYTLLALTFPGIFFISMFPVMSGSAKKHMLPFPVWYPYNVQNSLAYMFTYLHQIVSLLLLSLGSTTVDMFISALMVYIGAQCDILCDNLRNLGLNSEDFEGNVKNCIIHYTEILRFSVQCNNIFNFFMMAQFLSTSAVISVAVFLLALTKVSSFHFYSFLLATADMIMQIFNYCWFGSEIERKSSKIAYAAFESAWIIQCMPTKKNLIIFMEKTRTPVKLSTYNLIYLTLITFVKILQTAISYYMILRQLSGLK